MTALPSTEDLARLAKENYDDPQYLAALGLMLVTGRTATSLVQRALGIGYNDAARIVERIEADGIISRPNNCGKREVLDRREADRWQPIETCPQGDGPVLIYYPDMESDADYPGHPIHVSNREYVLCGNAAKYGATHWHPCPATPTPTTEASHDR